MIVLPDRLDATAHRDPAAVGDWVTESQFAATPDPVTDAVRK
jgi:hypothetical protein